MYDELDMFKPQKHFRLKPSEVVTFSLEGVVESKVDSDVDGVFWPELNKHVFVGDFLYGVVKKYRVDGEDHYVTVEQVKVATPKELYNSISALAKSVPGAQCWLVILMGALGDYLERGMYEEVDEFLDLIDVEKAFTRRRWDK